MKIFLSISITCCLLCLSACSRYEVTLNDRVLYEPPKLLRDFKVRDPQLQACLEQTIEDQNIKAVDELVRLDCSDGGIASLAGLQIFTALTTLKLSANRINDSAVLAGLKRLEGLSLANNSLAVLAGISALQQLQYLDVRGNQDLDCDQAAVVIGALPEKTEILLPEHCL